MEEGGGERCIDRGLSCASARPPPSPPRRPSASQVRQPSELPRLGPDLAQPPTESTTVTGGGGGRGMLRCERDPQNVARRRVHTPAIPRHTAVYPSTWPHRRLMNRERPLYPSRRGGETSPAAQLGRPSLSLKTVRRVWIDRAPPLSLSLDGERVQRTLESTHRIRLSSPPGATRRPSSPLSTSSSPLRLPLCIYIYVRIGLLLCLFDR